MNWFSNFINKSNKRVKISYLICVLFIALFLAIGIPTLARYKNRSSINDASLWDGSIAAGYKAGSGTYSDPYVISNGREFAYFAYALNQTNYANTYFILDNDILLNDGLFNYNEIDGLTYTKNNSTVSVTPYLESYSNINLFKSISSFKGHLNGNSYRIYGLFITSVEEKLALFKNLGGEIKDLYLENTVIYGGYNTAGLAAKSDGANINNVLVNGYVVGSGDLLATSEVVNIDNINKDINVNTTETINVELPHINGSITSIKLTGKYNISNEDSVLKINNNILSDGEINIDLDSLVNTLTIEYETSTDTTFEITDLEYTINYEYGYASGIVGDSNNTKFNGVINKAKVFGALNANGLVNTLSGTGTIINSYNTGAITSGVNANGLVNTIINNTTSITVTYSYNSGTLTGTDNYGLVNRVINNSGYIGIGRCFNTTLDYAVNEVNNSSLLINTVGVLANGVKNGLIEGSFDIISDFNYYSKLNGFNEFVDLDDLEVNSSNLWVYDDLPILYIDDINNPVASINISKYSWNNLGYKLHTVKFASSFSFTITSIDNMKPIKEVYYYISESKIPLKKSEINSITDWTQYTDAVTLEEEGFYVVYVKVLDYNDNVLYLNSDLLVLDLSASYVNITMNDSNWDSLNTDLEDIYLNTNATLLVDAVDELSGVKSVEYYLSDKYLTKEELDAIETWTTYLNNIVVNSRTGSIVYVKVLDYTDYVSYANSPKILIDGYRQSNLKAGSNINYLNNLIINSKSSVSMNYTFNNTNNYKDTYSHKFISNIKLPANTIVTLIDNSNSRVYRYKVTEEVNEILFNKFSEIGSSDSKKFSEFTTGKINDNFTINLDFSKTTLSTNLDNIKAYIVLLDGSDIKIPIMNETVNGFSVYNDYSYTVNLTSNYSDTIYYNTINTYNIDFNTTYSTLNNVLDSTLEGKSIGIALRVVDSSNNVVSKRNLRNITFTYNDKKYSAGSDGIIRINLNNGLSNTSGIIKVDTSIDNINLLTGVYKLQMGYYIASDGVYSNDITYTKDISMNVTNDRIQSNHIYNVIMTNNDRIISKEGNRNIIFRTLLYSNLDNPSIRMSLYKRVDYSAYNQSYTKIDLGEYINTNLTLYKDMIYNTPVVGNSFDFRDFTIEIDTTNFDTTGYKFIFDLYNGDTKIDSISKNIIIK